jgi:hypothetical protein
MVFSYSTARILKWDWIPMLDRLALQEGHTSGAFDVFACDTHAGVAFVPGLPGSGLPCSSCVPLKVRRV